MLCLESQPNSPSVAPYHDGGNPADQMSIW